MSRHNEEVKDLDLEAGAGMVNPIAMAKTPRSEYQYFADATNVAVLERPLNFNFNSDLAKIKSDKVYQDQNQGQTKLTSENMLKPEIREVQNHNYRNININNGSQCVDVRDVPPVPMDVDMDIDMEVNTTGNSEASQSIPKSSDAVCSVQAPIPFPVSVPLSASHSPTKPKPPSNYFGTPFPSFPKASAQGQVQSQGQLTTSSSNTPLGRILGNGNLFNAPPVCATKQSRNSMNFNFNASPASIGIGKLVESLKPVNDTAPVRVKLKKVEPALSKRMSFSESYFHMSNPPMSTPLSMKMKPNPTLPSFAPTTEMKLPMDFNSFFPPSLSNFSTPSTTATTTAATTTATTTIASAAATTTIVPTVTVSSHPSSINSEKIITSNYPTTPTPKTPWKESEDSFAIFLTPIANQNQTFSTSIFYTPTSGPVELDADDDADDDAETTPTMTPAKVKVKIDPISLAFTSEAEATDNNRMQATITTAPVTPLPVRRQRRAKENIESLVSKISKKIEPSSPFKLLKPSLVATLKSVSDENLEHGNGNENIERSNPVTDTNFEIKPKCRTEIVPVLEPEFESESKPKLTTVDDAVVSDLPSLDTTLVVQDANDVNVEVEQDVTVPAPAPVFVPVSCPATVTASNVVPEQEILELDTEENPNPLERKTIIHKILIHIKSSKELLKCRCISSTWKEVSSKILKQRNTVCIILNFEDVLQTQLESEGENQNLLPMSTSMAMATIISLNDSFKHFNNHKPFLCQRYIFKNPKLEDPNIQEFFKNQGSSITHISLSLRPTEEFQTFLDLLYCQLGHLHVLELLQSPKTWHWPNLNLPKSLPKLTTIILPKDYQSQNQHEIQGQGQNHNQSQYQGQNQNQGLGHTPIQIQQQELPLASFTGHSSPWLVQQILRAAVNLEQVINFPVGLLPVFQYENKVKTIKSTTLYFSKSKKPNAKTDLKRRRSSISSFGEDRIAVSADFGLGLNKCDYDFIRNYTAMANQNLQLSQLNNCYMNRIIQSSAMWVQIGQIVSKILYSSRHTLTKFETEPFGFLTGIGNQSQLSLSSSFTNDKSRGSGSGTSKKSCFPVFTQLDLLHFYMPSMYTSDGKQFLKDAIKSFFPYEIGSDIRTSFQNVKTIVFTTSISTVSTSTTKETFEIGTMSSSEFFIANLNEYFPSSIFHPGSFFSVTNFKFDFRNDSNANSNNSCTDAADIKTRGNNCNHANKADRNASVKKDKAVMREVKLFPLEFRRFLSLFYNVQICEVTRISLGILGPFLKQLFLSSEAWPELGKLVIYLADEDENNSECGTAGGGTGTGGTVWNENNNVDSAEAHTDTAKELKGTRAKLPQYPFLDEVITGLPEVRCEWLRANKGRVNPSAVEAMRSPVSILNLKKLKTFNVVFETRSSYLRNIHLNPVISMVSTVYGFLLMDQKLEGNFYCRRNN